MPTLTRE